MSGSEGGISKPTVARQKGGLYLPYQSIDFAVHTIRPWLVRIEQSMNKALFADSEKGHFYAQFNIDGLMRGDYKSRMEGYSIGRQNGWLSANDIRALENMNPIPTEEGGDTYLVNGNMVPIGLAGINIAVAAAVAANEAEQEQQDRQEQSSETEQTDQDSSQANTQDEPAPKKKRVRRKKKEGDADEQGNDDGQSV